MSDMNTFTITGRLVADAVPKTLPTGTELIEFKIANNAPFAKEASFFTCSYFGKGAQAIQQYLIKGKLIGLTGSLTLESFVGKDGNKVTLGKINVRDVTLLPDGKGKPVVLDDMDDEDFKAKYAKVPY